MLVTIKHLFTSLPTATFEVEVLGSASLSMCSDVLRMKNVQKKESVLFFMLE